MALKLQTTVDVGKSPLRLDHSSRILLMGSCFSDSMAGFMRQAGLEVLANPFGTLYNPLSIATDMERSLAGGGVGEEDLVQHDGLWHSFAHHGKFSSASKEECVSACNEAFARTRDFLSQPATVIVTFGTSWVFEREGRVVANCHKLPSSLFSRRMLDEGEIVNRWQPLVERLVAMGHKVIMTVSPIRHLADSAHGNQLSKATLLLAIDRLSCVDYFPAYEIMLDELRDYRFYADDMLHPSPLAQTIIWQRFQERYMDDRTVELCLRFCQLSKMRSHRPLNTESKAYDDYLAKMRELESQLSKEIGRTI